MDQNLRDPLRSLETHVGPILTAIGRTVDAIADGDTVASPGFAGAGPNRFRIRWIDRQRANRLHRLLVENRFERHAIVDRFPNSAAA